MLSYRLDGSEMGWSRNCSERCTPYMAWNALTISLLRRITAAGSTRTFNCGIICRFNRLYNYSSLQNSKFAFMFTSHTIGHFVGKRCTQMATYLFNKYQIFSVVNLNDDVDSEVISIPCWVNAFDSILREIWITFLFLMEEMEVESRKDIRIEGKTVHSMSIHEGMGKLVVSRKNSERWAPFSVWTSVSRRSGLGIWRVEWLEGDVDRKCDSERPVPRGVD